jgi:uncharacterized membrane protein YesL
MLGFMIKKAFFDMWDNFLAVILFNLGFIVLAMIPIWLPSAIVGTSLALAFIVQAIGILILFVYASGVSLICRDIANYEKAEFRRFTGYMKEAWPAGLVLGLIYIGIVYVFRVGIPVYSAFNNFLGLAAIVFLMWAVVIFALASQFYFPARAQLDTKIGKVLKKSFIIFFDNTFFALFVAIGTILITGVSVFTAMLIPGITGVLLWHQVGLKLRLYKYDYLEEHPEANRRNIPWEALLIDDKEKVGKRSLKGMIFPWKE